MPRISQQTKRNLQRSPSPQYRSKKTKDEPCSPQPSSQRKSQKTEHAADYSQRKLRESKPGSQKPASLDKTEIMNRASMWVQYILGVQQSLLPITALDLSKNTVAVQRKDYYNVLEKAKIILKQVYGFRLVPLDKKFNNFIAINDIVNNPLVSFDTDLKTKAHRAILFPVLTAIFMNGNDIPENKLWIFLDKIGIMKNPTFDDETLGDVRNIVKEVFTKQRYVCYEPANVSVTSGSGSAKNKTEYKFKWGIRALHEVKKIEILRFVSELCQVPMAVFPEQCAEVEDKLGIEDARAVRRNRR